MAELTPGTGIADTALWPTEDDLPYDNEDTMESQRHVLQMYLLIETLRLYWSAHGIEGFVGGNMFVHFNLERALNKDFRGPDFFAVLDVPWRERKSWVVWAEGKGPDLIIELLSDSTAHVDKDEKKRVYQHQLQVPEYFWFDPFTAELVGFNLTEQGYVPLDPDAQGWLVSQRLGLALVRWSGAFQEVEARWLRWATLDGTLLPTGAEQAAAAQQQVEAQQQQIAELERRLAQYRDRYGEDAEGGSYG